MHEIPDGKTRYFIPQLVVNSCAILTVLKIKLISTAIIRFNGIRTLSLDRLKNAFGVCNTWGKGR
jgi:hypothetical protein